MRLGVDLMGSDTSPLDLFPAILQAAGELREATLVVIASPITEQAIERMYGKTAIRFQSAGEVIEMRDDPIRAVRQKKNSSLMVGIRLLRKKKLDALVTLGNTGALITAASLSLTKKPGIKRPALLATLPSAKGPVSVIDVGGNIQTKASLLYQNALLGQEYHRKAFGIAVPSIGLLNIGQESKKGTEEHRQAFTLLSNLEGFIGNIEARDLFSGKVDVLVTDGFSGNVLLKTAEGVAHFIFETLATQTSPAWQPELKKLYHQFNWADYPGALVLGVEGLLIKSHGSSGPQALYSGLKGAYQLW